jgi:hypothetical protein
MEYGQAIECVGLTEISVGIVSAHDGDAIGQRVLKLQPDGLLSGFGISP